MRVAVELLGGGRPERIKQRLADDIAELEELIDELLMASRIEALGRSEPFEEVDLLALVAEEASRCGAELEGEQVTVRGDPRMLRRMVRNLLENAGRHGRGPVETEVAGLAAGAVVVRVADRGPGIPAAEGERIFTPSTGSPGVPRPRPGASGSAWRWSGRSRSIMAVRSSATIVTEAGRSSRYGCHRRSSSPHSGGPILFFITRSCARLAGRRSAHGAQVSWL